MICMNYTDLMWVLIELYEHLHGIHQRRLSRLGPNKVNPKKTHRFQKMGRSVEGRRKQVQSCYANGKAPRKQLPMRKATRNAKEFKIPPPQNSLLGLSKSLETLVI